MKKLSRLIQIKTRLEVYLITYALALGAVKRGEEYLFLYPNVGGKLLFLAATGAVFMAGAKMLQAIDYHNAFGTD